MKVIFYKNTLGNTPKKREIITAFAKGVLDSNNHYVEVADVYNSYEKADYVLMLGALPYWKKPGPKHTLKSCRQAAVAKHNKAIIIESGLIGDEHCRVSVGSQLPNYGNFMLGKILPDRWEKLNQSITPWRTDGEHILVCLQRGGAFSSNDIDPMNWLQHNINLIREHSSRPIVIRQKQSDQNMLDMIKNVCAGYTDINISENELEGDMKNCWAAVTFVSTVDIKLVQNGIPVFVNDSRSFTWELGNTYLGDIEKPKMLARDHLFNKLAYMQWNTDEMAQGIPWKRIKDEIFNSNNL